MARKKSSKPPSVKTARADTVSVESKSNIKKSHGGVKSSMPASASVTTVAVVDHEKVLRPVSLFISAIIALMAFLGGVLTPPSLYVVRQARSASLHQPKEQFVLPPHTPCTPSNLQNYLHTHPATGFHIVCFEPLNLDIYGKQINNAQPDELSSTGQFSESLLEDNNSIRLSFYRGAHASPLRRRVTLTAETRHRFGGVKSVPWSEVRETLDRELELLPEGPRQRAWAIFTPSGERIVAADDIVNDGKANVDEAAAAIERRKGKQGRGSSTILENKQVLHSLVSSGMVIITNGGVWMWPGVREGFQRTIQIDDPFHPSLNGYGEIYHQSEVPQRNVTLETLSLNPLVISINNFLTPEECEHIITEAQPTMKYSAVTLKDVDAGKAASQWRTSQSTFLSSNEDDILKKIDHRTASLTRIPRTYQEYVQVLRYGHGEKYDAHHDYFDPSAYKTDRNTLSLIENGRRNRFATVFWYLSDVPKGGETIFPRYGNKPPPMNHADCSVGLKVKPKRGNAIIFYSLDASGQLNSNSLHGACPVEEGTKWAANKWVWNAPIGYVKDDDD